MGEAVGRSKYLTQAGWNDVPHLAEEEKQYMIDSTPPYLLPARQYGDPVVGIGRIYPFDFNKIACHPFPIPASWPKVYALDPAWNRTAALWAAIDEANDIRYLYGEYYAAHMIPRLHAQAILLRGSWIPGVCDPAAEGSSPKDGRRLIDEYRKLGLSTLRAAHNEVAAGIQAVTDLITTGRMKVFTTLQYFRWEFNSYRRDLKEKIVKKNDHLMDDLRYLALGGFNLASADPAVVSSMASGSGFRSTGAADQKAGY